jgi:hypothetical protein
VQRGVDVGLVDGVVGSAGAERLRGNGRGGHIFSTERNRASAPRFLRRWTHGDVAAHDAELALEVRLERDDGGLFYSVGGYFKIALHCVALRCAPQANISRAREATASPDDTSGMPLTTPSSLSRFPRPLATTSGFRAMGPDSATPLLHGDRRVRLHLLRAARVHLVQVPDFCLQLVT